jgi:antitoxin HicB
MTQADRYRSDRYPFEVFWSEDDGGFIAVAPDLPGCSAFGQTQEQAVAELRHAIDAWKEAAAAADNAIPEPSRPDLDPSGKLLLRMPRTLHRDLIRSAKRENVSLNQHVIYLLTRATANPVLSSEGGVKWGKLALDGGFSGIGTILMRLMDTYPSRNTVDQSWGNLVVLDMFGSKTTELLGRDAVLPTRTFVEERSRG